MKRRITSLMLLLAILFAVDSQPVPGQADLPRDTFQRAVAEFRAGHRNSASSRGESMRSKVSYFTGVASLLTVLTEESVR